MHLREYLILFAKYLREATRETSSFDASSSHFKYSSTTILIYDNCGSFTYRCPENPFGAKSRSAHPLVAKDSSSSDMRSMDIYMMRRSSGISFGTSDANLRGTFFPAGKSHENRRAATTWQQRRDASIWRPAQARFSNLPRRETTRPMTIATKKQRLTCLLCSSLGH